MSTTIVDVICKENDVCPHESMKEFLKYHEEFLERVVTVYGRILESIIEHKYLEDFQDFIIMKNKL